jgi:dienelactone hydrolase
MKNFAWTWMPIVGRTQGRAWLASMVAGWMLFGSGVEGKAQVIVTGLVKLDESERKELREETDRLGREVVRLFMAPGVQKELVPDVAIFYTAVNQALTFDEFQQTNDVPEARRLLAMGFDRARALGAGRPDWLTRTGLVVRGFESAVDGSVQPYGVVVGKGYRPGGRLDVWLHGRDERLTELRFLRERLRSSGEFAPDDAVVVHPYGRFCNAFKFAGETDVMEAMEHATQAYGADRGRRSIRGFSMGGAGAWHLAAHHPGLWRAAAPGAGFAETADYTGVLGKEPGLPSWEQRLWHWYDATDYAANLRQVPLVAYSGEKDRQIQAARMMERAMQAEGLTLQHVIGPGVEHKYEPGAKREVARRVDALASTASPELRELDLTTWTLRYPAGEGNVWLRFEGLSHHWERARLRASVSEDGKVRVRTEGVTAFAMARPPGVGKGRVEVDLDGERETFGAGNPEDGWWHFRKSGKSWKSVKSGPSATVKRPGLQGPIDDAFMGSFVVVVPSKLPVTPEELWVDRSWRQFVRDWRAQFRGECRIAKDTDVTPEDLKSHHVVLWGTPENNVLLGKIAGRLPLQWKGGRLRLSGRELKGEALVPQLIAPNPLNPDRYVVVNSGHTFASWNGTNARQTPRLPDWAVVEVGDGKGPGRVVEAGFFGEDWK